MPIASDAYDWMQISRVVSRVASAAAGLIGLVELVVWIGQPASVPATSALYYMKANAALAVLLLAVAVWLHVPPHPSWRRWAARGLGAFSLLVTGATLAEYLLSWSPSFDLWLGPDPTSDDGRMALQSAIVLSLCAAALLTFTEHVGPRRWIPDLSLLVAGLTLEVMAIGYFDHATLLYDATGQMTPARQSAIAQMLVCTAIVFGRAGRGAYAILTDRGASGMAVRVLMPVVVLLPLLVGRLKLLGEDHGWFAASYGEALFSVGQTAAFGLLVCLLAQAIARVERQYRLERQRREEVERYVAICAWTRRVRWEGAWISIEDFLERRFGLTVSHGISDEALAEQLATLEGVVAAQAGGPNLDSV